MGNPSAVGVKVSREDDREGGREGASERVREGGREGRTEGRREGAERGKEGGRKLHVRGGTINACIHVSPSPPTPSLLPCAVDVIRKRHSTCTPRRARIHLGSVTTEDWAVGGLGSESKGSARGGMEKSNLADTSQDEMNNERLEPGEAPSGAGGRATGRAQQCTCLG